MLEGVFERLAGIIAAKVVEELFERLPDISDIVTQVLPVIVESITKEIGDLVPNVGDIAEEFVKMLPQLAERVVDQILSRLPFPFNGR
jgi:hypothetical protein